MIRAKVTLLQYNGEVSQYIENDRGNGCSPSRNHHHFTGTIVLAIRFVVFVVSAPSSLAYWRWNERRR